MRKVGIHNIMPANLRVVCADGFKDGIERMTQRNTLMDCAAAHLLRRSYVRNTLTPSILGKCSLSALLLLVLLPACVFVRAPTAEELSLLDNPPSEVKRLQNLLTPLALQWFDDTEADLLSKGRPLSDTETTMARAVGVQNPERVRVIVLAEFPLPSNETLRTETVRYGLGSSAEGGRTMGYVIMLKERFAKKRWILAHELTHVAQQERMGREAFVRRFIAEQELLGYRRAPLEIEANKFAREFM